MCPRWDSNLGGSDPTGYQLDYGGVLIVSSNPLIAKMRYFLKHIPVRFCGLAIAC